MSEKKFEEARGLEAILTLADNNGIRIHAAGFKNGDVLTIPKSSDLIGRLRQITGSDAKYMEFEITVGKVKKFASLGSLYRSHKMNETDENFVRPNKETTLSELLQNISGKEIKLVKIDGAKAPNFTSGVFEPVTCFKYEIKK